MAITNPQPGQRVVVGTQHGRFTGYIVVVTPLRGNLGIQIPGHHELVYRNPNHVDLAPAAVATTKETS